MQIVLETARLVLRRFTAADVESLVELDRDPEVMRFVNGGRPTPREEVENEILPRFLAYYASGGDYGVWAAVEKSTGRFVGWFGLHPTGDRPPGEVELGYRLRRAAWGKGYATEASRALVEKAFVELGARLVWAQAMTVNTASRRVMEKAGLRYVRTFHVEWPHDIEGTAEGDVEYALTRAQWEARRGCY